MSDKVAVISQAEAIERVVVGGDLAKLSAEERLGYYRMVCESVGLNPLTKPFEYITLNGKLTLYARKDATDQLRNNNQVSITIQAREFTEGCYVVTSRATLPSGRTDESIGAVPIDTLKGEARANAMMKAETKAKRRVTLSICGLGMLDETEIETIPSARPPVAVTTAPISVAPPKKAAAATTANVKGTSNPPKAAEPATVYPELPPEEAFEPDACIDLPRQKALHRQFREAIVDATAQSHADAFLQDWLKHRGYTGPDGKGTTKTIPMVLFEEVKAEACKWAASLK